MDSIFQASLRYPQSKLLKWRHLGLKGEEFRVSYINWGRNLGLLDYSNFSEHKMWYIICKIYHWKSSSYWFLQV